MKITLGYARKQLAQFVGEGYSPEEPFVVDQINTAINWLLPKVRGGNIYCRYRFNITSHIITLPKECVSLIKLIVDGNNVEIHNRWFEFMGYGTGALDYGGGYSADISYLGTGFPTFADPISPSYLLVFSEKEETGKNMTIMGADENGKDIIETIEIRKTNPVYTKNKFKKIESIEKDRTDSYVVLSTFDQTNNRINLGYYAPSETNPSYTRYFIKGNTEVMQGIGIVRLGFVPVYNDYEPLLIQNLPALSLMLKALHYYSTGDIQKGQAYELQAIRLIEEQISAEEPLTNEIDIGEPTVIVDTYEII